jgi:hypothetical protein
MPDLSTIASPAAAMATPAAMESIASAQTSRFPLLAACVAVAAGLGALAGSLGALSIGHASSTTEVQTTELSRGVHGMLTQMKTEIAALKTTLETSNRQAITQFGKISERFDRTERALNEPGAKLAALSDSVARIERRVAAAPAPAPEVTGSIAANNPVPPPETKEAPKPVILDGWVIRDIYRGRALVESRNGLFEIAPGSNLPGIGRVETIKQQNGRWVVVTPKGLIVSMR